MLPNSNKELLKQRDSVNRINSPTKASKSRSEAPGVMQGSTRPQSNLAQSLEKNDGSKTFRGSYEQERSSVHKLAAQKGHRSASFSATRDWRWQQIGTRTTDPPVKFTN